MSDWLNNLEVGDKVVVLSGWGSESVGAVGRLTETLIFTAAGTAFRRKDGRSRGSSFRSSWLKEPTQERLDKIRHTALAGKLKVCDWKSLTMTTLEAVHKLLMVEGE